MKNEIIALAGKDPKVLGFTDEQIIISSKKHKTFESLLESNRKSKMLETVTNIPLASVKELYYNEKNDNFTIKFDVEGITRKQSVRLAYNDTRESLLSEISEIVKMNKTVSTESKIKPLLLNSTGFIIIPLATWTFWDTAMIAQNGGHYVASGRRSGLKQLLSNGAEALGPTGVIIIGILALLIMFYITRKRYKNPASEISFK
ncbi:MAG: hypothetical protein N4A49_11270 [Marinifilaceae bacterium]|jgi:hypothetical protein|nr:hypothetical protein [Marinifilaceae bacterium]